MSDRPMCLFLMPNNGMPYHHGESLAECLLSEGHEDEHLVRMFDGRFILWAPDHSYDCCKNEKTGEPYCDKELCECYTYRKISTYEAIEILTKDKNGKSA